MTLCAAPILAYTVVLKDGSQIQAREKYVIEGDKAIITLVSGTQTFLDASEIDVEKTELANEHDLGNALVLEDGAFVQKPITREEAKRQERVGDLIERGEASMRGTSRSTPATEARNSASSETRIEQVERRPFRDLKLAAEIMTGLTDRGIERAALYQGTEQGRPLVELKTDSEASVFRGLEVAAEVLLAVQELSPGSCEVVELLLTTSSQERAGEFELTTDLALALQDEEVDVASIFVRHVRF